jgi:acetyltransferase-like isoleucine patch superfamily enzyme
MRRVRHIHLGELNSLWYWTKAKNPLVVTRNYVVVAICRILPSLRLKNILYRSIGVKVGRHVSFGLESTIDIFFPELIEIGDNTIIGYNSVILAHEFLRNELRVGEVVIGRDVTIGTNVTILPGIEIGDGAVVSSNSLVNRDVPPYTMVGGVPARVIKTLKN